MKREEEVRVRAARLGHTRTSPPRRRSALVLRLCGEEVYMLGSRRPFTLVALLLLSTSGPAAAQTPQFDRIMRTVDNDDDVEVEREVLEVRADRSVALSRAGQPGVSGSGLPPAVTSHLTDAELQALNAALGAPALRAVPHVLPNPPDRRRMPGRRFDLSVDLPGAQPDLRATGELGHYGAWAPALEPLMNALGALQKRVRALDARMYLEITKIPGLVKSIRADEDLELVLEGPGAPGVEFDHLEVFVHPSRLSINAVGRSVGTAPARPFRETLRVPRPGAASGPTLLVVVNTRAHGLSGHATPHRLEVFSSPTPRDGLHHGVVHVDGGTVSLKIRESRDVETRLRLHGSPADLAVLARLPGEHVHLRGRPGAAPADVVVEEVLSPVRRTITGQVLSERTLQLEDGEWVYMIGPAARALRHAGDRRVELDVWFFEPSLGLLPRAHVLRIAATARKDARLKRGLRSVGRVARGDPVWVTGTTFFGRRVLIEPVAGGRAGSASPDAVDIGDPLPVAPTSGILGALPGSP